MPISTPQGKSNAAPPGQTKYYKQYMTPHTSGVVPGAVTTGTPPPGVISPEYGGYGMGGGYAPSGEALGTVEGAGHIAAKKAAHDINSGKQDVDWFDPQGPSYAQQAFGMGGYTPEMTQFEAFAGGQELSEMEAMLADQYDQLLSGQLQEQSSQQQAAEDMLRAQAMQMGVGGSPGGALSDWAGVQSQGARDRAQVKLASEAARENARMALGDEFTRLDIAAQGSVTALASQYQEYFDNKLRDNLIGELGIDLNPELVTDLKDLFQLLSHNGIQLSDAVPMIEDLASIWRDSNVAGYYQNEEGQIVYPNMRGIMGSSSYWKGGSPYVRKRMMEAGFPLGNSGHLTPGMQFRKEDFGATAHLAGGMYYNSGQEQVQIYPPEYGQQSDYWQYE